MTDFSYAEILQKKLKNYFSDKTISQTDIIEKITNIIMQTVDCDQEKLIFALEQLSTLKQNNIGMNFQQTDNVFDVSSHLQMHVKGFLSGEKPHLYFYKEGEKLPFFKIKSYDHLGKKRIIVEATNNSDVFKNKVEVGLNQLSANSYIVKDDFVCEDARVFLHSVIASKTSREGSLNETEKPILNNEESNFYNFIRKIFIQNGISLPNELTAEETEVIFGYFYNTLGSIVSYENEFDIKDLIVILNNFLNKEGFEKESFDEQNGLSMTAKLINDEMLKRRFIDNNLEIETFGKTGTPLTVKVAMVSEYISIDIFDNSIQEKVCNYIACKTNEGFFMFRNIKDSSFVNYDQKTSSFTININSDEIKFTVIGNNSKGKQMRNPIDISVRFNKSNEITLNVDQVSYTDFSGDPLNSDKSKIVSF